MAKPKVSKRYRELRQRLNQLRCHLLPRNFSPTGCYSDRQLDLARAYRLLAHSEFESFLEERASETAINAMQLWKRQQKLTVVLVGLLAFAGMPMDGPPEKMVVKSAMIDISARLNSAIGAYQYNINKNNGIKEVNVLQILYPIGIQPSDLDPLWINTMDGFGARRGETAHTAAKRAKQPVDPADELRVVTELLIGLEDVDKKINLLLCK